MCRTAPDEAVKIDCPNMRGCFNSLSCLRIYCGHLLYFALRRHDPNALMPRKLVNAIIYKLHKHLVTEWLVNNHHPLLLPSFFLPHVLYKIVNHRGPSSIFVIFFEILVDTPGEIDQQRPGVFGDGLILFLHEFNPEIEFRLSELGW